jgi:hypothetical protein
LICFGASKKVLARTIPPINRRRGYSAMREEAMADFKSPVAEVTEKNLKARVVPTIGRLAQGPTGGIRKAG